MTADLIPIPVPGTAPILALDEGDQKWVAIRPVCDQLGIDPDTQRKKLDQAEWATTVIRTVVAADGREREMVMLDADHLPMWLGTIQTSRVNQAARATLISFQREAARALRDFFYTGVAVASELTQFDILRAAIDRLEQSERVALEAKAIAERADARLDGIEGKHDWFSALGFARLNGLPTYEKFLRRLGKCASMIARTHEITPDKAQHAHYGSVNSYPEWIWKLAAVVRRGEKSAVRAATMPARARAWVKPHDRTPSGSDTERASRYAPAPLVHRTQPDAWGCASGTNFRRRTR